MLDMPHANDALDILKTYIRAGIPALRRGEVSFWGCSCLPASNVYSRINVNWQEVFTAFVNERELWFSLHVANSPLVQTSSGALDRLLKRYPSARAF